VSTLCVCAGALHLALRLSGFTLAWTHSVEKVRWEEDYRLSGEILVLESARIRGTGAGMEPPPDALLEQGWWHYRPVTDRVEKLVLANSPFGGHYQLCVEGRCRDLPFSTTSERRPTTIFPCTTRVRASDSPECYPER
jgi:hypothetical protein